MDSDPGDSNDGLITVLDFAVDLWIVNGIQEKKEG